MARVWGRRAAGWLCGASLATVAAASPPSAFRLYVRDDGVYGIGYEALAAAGLQGEPASAALAVRNAGQPVPIWVEDGGDGRFGPGDRIELVGRHRSGAATYYDPHSAANVYVLDVAGERPARLRQAPAPAPRRAEAAVPLSARRHLERNLILLRYTEAQKGDGELWYWAKLTQIDAQPLRINLDLTDLDAASERPLDVRLRLRGWSRPAAKPSESILDHRVEVALDGRFLAAAEWNNEAGAHELRLPPVAASTLTAGAHELTLRVPKRPGSGGDPLVDVSVLDWVEVSYPRRAQLARDQDQGRLELDDAARSLRLSAPGRSSVVLYGEDGSRHAARTARSGELVFGPLGAGAYHWVADGRLQPAASIAPDEPSTLASTDRRADYLIVTTAELRPALAPLVEHRRRQGLEVETVDVQDVYDEFHHGIPNPQALRAFIAHAYHRWRAPAPRFVLLVGDASWDLGEQADGALYPDAAFSPAHGTVFAQIPSATYPAEKRAHRNLVPTWSYDTRDGHAAGDNWFVAVDGDDELPDLAIGRFPVATPEEVAAIVAKVVRYETAGARDAERRQVLWISNEDATFQAMSDRLAAEVEARGYAGEKIYARPGVVGGEAEQAAIKSAIEREPLLVHFVGHGGRFIWRTGPPDWTKHRDLFNLDDVASLAPGDRLPVVLAMTCYSAPFDHPTADSIGEKFLREPDRGAVAVVAASWRIAPSLRVSRALVDELLRAPTVGEALARAKRAANDRDFVEQYNLLGDPALRLQRPPATAAVER